MIKKFMFMFMLLAVMLIVSLPLAAASAQGDASSGTVDADGDLVVEALPALEPAAPGASARFAAGVEPQFGANPAPWPYFPNLDVVYTRTPTFVFTENPAATRYRVTVKNSFTDAVLYTFKGAPVCSAGYCSLTPDYLLKYFDFSNNKGKYLWQVQARVGGAWESPSDFIGFSVVSPGFNNDFNTSVGKWQAVTGNWVRTDKGHLKTPGVIGMEASVMHRNIFLDFDYSVTMKRKLTDATQGLIVWGDPTSYVPQNGRWNSGVYFLYRSNQQYAIFQMKDGVLSTLKSYAFSSAIDGFGWNTLRVVADSPDLHFYINGEFLATVTPTIANEGYVGITAYKNNNALKEPLLVDLAVLTSEIP